MKKILFTVFLCLQISSLLATETDTTSTPKHHDKVMLWKKAIAPSSLFLGAIIVRKYDTNIRDYRNETLPNYSYNYDNILQITPALATLTLRTCGVKGRSDSWYEMLSAMAFSTLTTAAFTEGLKNTIGRTRPHSEYQRNSFPSGHTMTAFSSATMLHKEYGDISPWYSICGYTTASIVGINRILNNRHWTSDVLAGAGFGILSGELGYLMSDCLFGKTRTNLSFKEMRPSFFGINANYSPEGNDIPNIIPDHRYFRFSQKYGYGYSIEGAYFPFKHIGIGGKTSLIYNFFDLDYDFLDSEENEEKGMVDDFESDFRTKSYSFTPGLYLAMPVSKRVLFGCKYLFGLGGSFSFNLDFNTRGEDGNISHGKIFDEYNYGWAMETGAFCKVLVTRNIGLNLSADYNHNSATYRFFQSKNSSRGNYNLVFALGVNVLLDD
ncbi:MAG: phosphatase PAP2 family protein [Paludibacteraceae bacterium]